MSLTCSNWKSAQQAKKCKGINVLVECRNGFSECCLFMKLSVAVTCFNFISVFCSPWTNIILQKVGNSEI